MNDEMNDKFDKKVIMAPEYYDIEEPQKPVVYFTGNPIFEYGRAIVYAIDHPTRGTCEVVTSKVVETVSDTEFHTLNTVYKRITNYEDFN